MEEGQNIPQVGHIEQNPIELVPVQLTVWDRVDEFTRVVHAHASQHRIRESRSALEDFVIYLSGKGLSRSTVNGFGLYLSENRGYALSTIALKVRCVKQFLVWVWKMGYTQERWYEFLPPCKEPPWKEPKIITQHEYADLVDAAPNWDYAWLIVCAWHTGFRLGDCATIAWPSIDRLVQMIKLVPRKSRASTGKPVYIPYLSGSDLHHEIEQRWEARDLRRKMDDEFYVCPNMAEAYLSMPTGLSTMVNRIFGKAGIEGKSFKHFRSTFESRLANSGMNMALAAQITGRSKVDVLMKYIKPDYTAIKDGVAKALKLHETHEGFK